MQANRSPRGKGCRASGTTTWDSLPQTDAFNQLRVLLPFLLMSTPRALPTSRHGRLPPRCPGSSASFSKEFCGCKAGPVGVRGPCTAVPLSSVHLSLQSLFKGTQPTGVHAGTVQKITTGISRQLQNPSSTSCPPGLQHFCFQDPPTPHSLWFCNSDFLSWY